MNGKLKTIIATVCVLIILGCAAEQKRTTEGEILNSDLSEKGKTWLMVLAETDKTFALLVLIGVIGGAAAFYFKDSKLLGVPISCAAGCAFLKFLVTAGDILAYICLAAIVIFLVAYGGRRWRALTQVVKGGELFKKDLESAKLESARRGNIPSAIGFNTAQEIIQTPATTKLVKAIKKKLKKGK